MVLIIQKLDRHHVSEGYEIRKRSNDIRNIFIFEVILVVQTGMQRIASINSSPDVSNFFYKGCNTEISQINILHVHTVDYHRFKKNLVVVFC